MPKLTLGSTSDPKLKNSKFHSHIKLTPHLRLECALVLKDDDSSVAIGEIDKPFLVINLDDLVVTNSHKLTIKDNTLPLKSITILQGSSVFCLIIMYGKKRQLFMWMRDVNSFKQVKIFL